MDCSTYRVYGIIARYFANSWRPAFFGRTGADGWLLAIMTRCRVPLLYASVQGHLGPPGGAVVAALCRPPGGGLPGARGGRPRPRAHPTGYRLQARDITASRYPLRSAALPA